MTHFTHIRLHSGRRVNPLKPRPQDISIEDIAWNLSHLCRFTGASKWFYSVASHCVFCAQQAPAEHALAVLMHDSAEHILADLNTQCKALLPQYKAMELRLEAVISRKYGLPFPFDPIVKEIDLRMLKTEMKQLLPGDDYKEIPFAAYDIKIPHWSPEKARREFLKAFRRYTR